MIKDKVFHYFLNNGLLITQLTRRDIIGRYRGSILGLLWSFVNPILMLSIYTFVFGMVFKARWGQEQENQLDFALILFSGLIVFNLFAECLSRAPMLIVHNVNYVKKVIFPLEILPIVSLGAALFHACASLLVLLIFFLVTGHSLSPTLFLLPLVWMPLLLLTLGLSWLLASLGVFLRDIGQFINMLLTVLLFMSPVFYPLAALPESIRPYLVLNPLTLAIEHSRDVMIWGTLPDGQSFAIYSVFSLAIFCLGLLWFNKTRKGFADVL